MRSAMRAASQLPGRGPTDVDVLTSFQIYCLPKICSQKPKQHFTTFSLIFLLYQNWDLNLALILNGSVH